MTIAVIVLGVVLCLVSYIAWIQWSKVGKLEDIANTLARKLDDIGDTIKDAKQRLDNPRLKEAFSNDDEVGTFFKEIESIQNELNLYIPDEEVE